MVHGVGKCQLLEIQKQLQKVCELVSRDQRITLKLTEDQLCIKQEMICPIFHNNLGMRKISIMFFHTVS